MVVMAIEREGRNSLLVGAKDKDSQNQEPSTKREVSLTDIKRAMEPLCQFLERSFMGKPQPLVDRPISLSDSNLEEEEEGYLFGSRRHVNIIFDVFSITICRISAESSLSSTSPFQSTLFVNGQQFNTKRNRIEEIQLLRNDILAFAISVALQDDDLILEMGLMDANATRTVGGGADGPLWELELLPLKDHRHPSRLFTGDYSNTIMARRVVTLLIAAGLRKVAYETIMDESDGWDIYDLAAGAAWRGKMYSRSQQRFVEAGAITCALIQLLVPIFLIFRGLQEETGDLTFDVYFARLFFGMYAIFYEAKTWDVDNGDRVTGFLAFLPEFSTFRLILGMAVNKLAKIVVSIAILILMLRSYTVFDVTLNALALYFILDVDDELVDDRTLEGLLRFQRQQ